VVREHRLQPPSLIEAANRQMKELPYYNAFFQTSTIPAIELAELLAEVTPPQFKHVFYGTSGSEGNDTVVRLVRHYWALQGQPRSRRHLAPQRLPRLHHGRRLARRHGLHARPDAAEGRAHRTSISRTSGEAAGETPEEFGLARAGNWRRRSWKSARRTSPRSSASRSRARAA
jgi:putrescine aminotransferase